MAEENKKPSVIQALRQFMPAFLEASPPLRQEQRRAIWALENCRTATLGGSAHRCADCGTYGYAYHSCNNKACPQCGRGATAQWVERQLNRRVAAPYFMVTFTLPSELRSTFFGPQSKEVFDAFFSACSAVLSEKLADPKHLGAVVSGYSMVLHTWNQQLLFHPHIHCIVPGAGLDAMGNYVEVKRRDFLLAKDILRAALRHHFGQQLKVLDIECDPSVWRKKWSVNVKAFGDGENAIKYLGRYVSRSVIGDSRILKVTDSGVTFRWKDRDNPFAEPTTTLPGAEFVRRYLRHVLPPGLRGVRYYGYCHPSAKEKWQKVREGAEQRRMKARSKKEKQANASIGTDAVPNCSAEPQKLQEPERQKGPACPCCGKPMQYLYPLPKAWLPGLAPCLGRKPRARPEGEGANGLPNGPSPPS